MATPTIQLSQYITWTQGKLDDYSFDGTLLTEYANEVNKEICNQPVPWPFMEKLFSALVTSGQNTYNFPTDMQAPINVEIVAPDNRAAYLDFMPYKEFDQRYPDPTQLTPATPTLWTRVGLTWLTGPSVPDQAYTIQMRYIKVPTTTTGTTSVLDVPDDFSELVVLGMYARALEHNDQPDYAAAQYQRFQAMLALMKQRYGIMQTGQVQVMQNRRTLLRGR